jgi:hypothetical protein
MCVETAMGLLYGLNHMATEFTLTLLIGFGYNGYFVTGTPFLNGVMIAVLLIAWATIGRAASI